MRVKARVMMATVLSFIILGFMSVAATAAVSPAGSMADHIVGHWQLVSITVSGAQPYGPNPKGSMIVDDHGHFSIIVISGGDAPNVALFGTCMFDAADSSMTLTIEGSSLAGFKGQHMKRLLTISGDELIAETTAPGPIAAKALGLDVPADLLALAYQSSIKMTWKRPN